MTCLEISLCKSYFLCLFKFALTVLNFNFCVLPSFWKDISSKYRILDWWFLLFSSNTLKMFLHCSLPTQFLMRKMLSFFFSVPLWDVSFFSGCLYNFPFIIVFSNLITMCSCGFLCFFCLGSLHLLNLLFLVFIKFGMFLAIISSNTFFILLPQSGSPISFEWLIFQMPLKFYLFFSLIFFLDFILVVFIAVSSDSLIISSTVSNLLLVTSSVILFKILYF